VDAAAEQSSEKLGFRFCFEGARLQPLRATAARNTSFPAIRATPVIA
jgi:hypothetical protein